MKKGFTLIELLVVIAVLGVLAAGVFVAINPLKRIQDARNAQRKMDLGQIANALEAYYVSHGGKYPSTNSDWCGRPGTYYDYTQRPANCSDSWIPGLVADGDLKVLPQDPTNKATSKCGNDDKYASYLYRSDVTDYKLLAHCTPEGDLLSTDKFYDPIRPTHTWQISSPGGIGW